MEFYKSKMNGCEVTIVFTGPRYYFYNAWYGWIAVAIRDEENENGDIFDLYVGNQRCVGSTFFSNENVIKFCKRQINRIDSRYISKKIKFCVKKRNLEMMQVDLTDNFNDL